MNVNDFRVRDLVIFRGWDGYVHNSFNPLIIEDKYVIEGFHKKNPSKIKLMGVRGYFESHHFYKA